jgi:dephospho-CoA kinase
MKVIGLTGGVACGKTTVADRLETKGFPVIDTDRIARDLLANDKIIQKQVSDAFGTVDRKKLREIIFGNVEKRTKLEQILHPPILAEVRRRLDDLRKRKPEPKAAVVVIPLLYETEGESHVDEVLAVVSREEHQVARLMARDKISKGLALQMIASQIANEEKASRAKHVVRNDGTLQVLLEAVDELSLTLSS